MGIHRFNKKNFILFDVLDVKMTQLFENFLHLMLNNKHLSFYRIIFLNKNSLKYILNDEHSCVFLFSNIIHTVRIKNIEMGKSCMCTYTYIEVITNESICYESGERKKRAVSLFRL